MPNLIRISRTAPLFIVLLLASPYAQSAEEPALHQFRSLSLEAAVKAAWEAVRDCRKRGYSVAIAVAIPRRCCAIVTPVHIPSKPLFARLGRRTVFVNPLLISPAC